MQKTCFTITTKTILCMAWSKFLNSATSKGLIWKELIQAPVAAINNYGKNRLFLNREKLINRIFKINFKDDWTLKLLFFWYVLKDAIIQMKSASSYYRSCNNHFLNFCNNHFVANPSIENDLWHIGEKLIQF